MCAGEARCRPLAQLARAEERADIPERKLGRWFAEAPDGATVEGAEQRLTYAPVSMTGVDAFEPIGITPQATGAWVVRCIGRGSSRLGVHEARKVPVRVDIGLDLALEQPRRPDR